MTNSNQSQLPVRLTETERDQFIREGYVIVRGLLPEDAVVSTRESLLSARGMKQDDPASWKRSATVLSEDFLLTLPCWTEEVLGCAAELAGPNIARDNIYSPAREQQGLSPNMKGYIPILNYPTPGELAFDPPTGAHIDGIDHTTLFPAFQYLVVFAYLTETAAYGGATAVWPGSHRKLFEYWLARGKKEGDRIPDSTFDLDLGDPLPAVGSAGDVIFMHYLLVHSGSANHSDHIRIGLNSAIQPSAGHPYIRKAGLPATEWTPIDCTLRTDNLRVGG